MFISLLSFSDLFNSKILKILIDSYFFDNSELKAGDGALGSSVNIALTFLPIEFGHTHSRYPLLNDKKEVPSCRFFEHFFHHF